MNPPAPPNPDLFHAHVCSRCGNIYKKKCWETSCRRVVKDLCNGCRLLQVKK